jgi:hypothetical protein
MSWRKIQTFEENKRVTFAFANSKFEFFTILNLCDESWFLELEVKFKSLNFLLILFSFQSYLG